VLDDDRRGAVLSADRRSGRPCVSEPRREFRRSFAAPGHSARDLFPRCVEEPPPADLDRLRAYFREAFLEAVGDDYEVVREPAPDALRVHAQIIDLKLTGANGNYEPSQRLRQLVANGELTFLMELQDSVSGRTLARAEDTTPSADAERPDADASWESVRLAAQRWVGLFRAFLDANLSGTRQGSST
jgi:hypothetical protein